MTLQGNWVVADFVTNYLPLALFPVLYLGAKFYYWKQGGSLFWVSAEKVCVVCLLSQATPKTLKSKMDFVTNIAEIEADT